MANPHTDLEKLEKDYTTADPEPVCWCGKPLIHIDTYDDTSEKWQHATTDPMYAHAISVWRNAGDPDVLDAVREIRHLRQLVEDAKIGLRDAYALLLYEEKCCETEPQARDIGEIITKVEQVLSILDFPRLPKQAQIE